MENTWLKEERIKSLGKNIEILEEDLLEIEIEMLETIDKVDEYCYKKGTIGGLRWGFDCLDKAFEGLQPGLMLVAGMPNAGKSSLCMQLSWQIALANQEPTEENPFKSYVLYFSLDDNNNEILPRIVAIDQKIPINAVKSPKKYEDNPNFVARRKVGMTRLKEGCRYFKIKDANGGTSVEWIEREIKRHYIQLQEKDENIKLVVFVDNFHDITIEDLRLSDNEKYDYIADKLSQICTQLDIPIICTAEFRKLNSSRRPTMEDIRASIKIEYEAKAIMLCYNEVGMRGDSANIYWLDGTEQAGTAKRPVFEVHVGKNKYASFKGRLFFDFRPEMAHMTEADEEDTKRYNQMIHG